MNCINMQFVSIRKGYTQKGQYIAIQFETFIVHKNRITKEFKKFKKHIEESAGNVDGNRIYRNRIPKCSKQHE